MALADQDLDSYNTYMVSDDVLNEVTQRLVDGFNPEKIILFGSQARGTADDRSDVDILVIGRFEGERRKVVLEMDRALDGLHLARDILILTPEEFKEDREIPGTIARPAWLEGKVLYEGTEPKGALLAREWNAFYAGIRGLICHPHYAAPHLILSYASSRV